MEGDSETSKAITPATKPGVHGSGGQLPPLGLERGGLPNPKAEDPSPGELQGAGRTILPSLGGDVTQWAWKVEHPSKED